MSTVTLEALRWRDQPSQATITVDGGPPRVHLQVTAPRDVGALCVGRPAEELPRILPLLSPAHHLCAAEALDRLFGVEPPAPARQAREALRLALVLRHHLRKFYFLASSLEDPFAEFWSEPARRGRLGLRPLLEDLMRHVSLGQEAATILGGRADHPLTAIAGGVSRALKPEHLARLGEIAAACVGFAERLAGVLRERAFPEGGMLGEARGIDPGALACLTLAPEPDALLLRDPGGAAERFAATALFEKIALRRESWSREPFAFLKAKGWHGYGAETAEGLFAVGPLARLAGGAPLPTPLAEAERLRMVEALGPPPRFEVVAAWWALLVELLGAAEGLAALCRPELLTGPTLRAIPKAPGREGHAALESPQGLVYHELRADDRGLVEEVRVLDAATANNGLFARVAQKAAEASLARGERWDETKKRIELALLAY